ncbi:MAG: hypothetical protein JWN98_699, partial [Abditibacteriota bacterium]|nr:hypothetical protein [Abditibacteriota bacterium]
PNPQVALPVVVAATQHAFTHAPQLIEAGATKYLWHATIHVP